MLGNGPLSGTPLSSGPPGLISKVISFFAQELADVLAFFGFKGSLAGDDLEVFHVREEIRAFAVAPSDHGLIAPGYVTSDGNGFTIQGENRVFRANPRQRR